MFDFRMWPVEICGNATLSAQLQLESITILLRHVPEMAKRNQIHQAIEVSEMNLSCQNSWALQSQKV